MWCGVGGGYITSSRPSLTRTRCVVIPHFVSLLQRGAGMSAVFNERDVCGKGGTRTARFTGIKTMCSVQGGWGQAGAGTRRRCMREDCGRAAAGYSLAVMPHHVKRGFWQKFQSCSQTSASSRCPAASTSASALRSSLAYCNERPFCATAAITKLNVKRVRHPWIPSRGEPPLSFYVSEAVMPEPATTERSRFHNRQQQPSPRLCRL